MQATVTFRHLPPSDGARTYALEKIERLQKFLRKPIEAHIILSVVKRRHVAEAVVTGKGLSLAATVETGDLYEAIDLMVDKILRQVKTQAAKRKSHRGESSARVAAAVNAVEPEQPLVKRQRVAVLPLSLRQAVERLKRSKNDFLLFESKETGILSLVHRRKDGEIGLVEPESVG